MKNGTVLVHLDEQLLAQLVHFLWWLAFTLKSSVHSHPCYLNDVVMGVNN